ncbi:11332_t:CDS:1, partial [Entrophospora sp. SA101]
SGGTPYLLKAGSVYSHGSSQPFTYFSLTSLAIFHFDKTVC